MSITTGKRKFELWYTGLDNRFRGGIDIDLIYEQKYTMEFMRYPPSIFVNASN